jgi:hypothetical protein
MEMMKSRISRQQKISTRQLSYKLHPKSLAGIHILNNTMKTHTTVASMLMTVLS